MENTAFIALSRQQALAHQLEVIANNVANMNTTGFKAERMMFVDHVIPSRSSDAIRPTPLSFVRDLATLRDTSEGAMVNTGNPLDVAVRGEGYFVIETPEGERYTRNGRFRLDESGQLVTEGGHAVMTDGNQPLYFAPEDQEISIANDGMVETENGELARLRIVRFDNPADMSFTGDNLYRSDADPEDMLDRDVVQGFLEGSNVDGVVEISRMIDLQRSYESVRRFIEREDERVRSMVREVAKPI